MDTAPTILAVDDQYQDLVALERMLRDVGATVVPAMSGTEALAATLDHDFALAIIDAHMPVTSGYALAELLRSTDKTRHVPIIFVSEEPESESLEFKCADAGPVDCIAKPPNPAVLLSKVRLLLAFDQQKRELERIRGNLDGLVIERTSGLRRSEEQFRLLFNSGSDAVFVYHMDDQGVAGIFVQANDVACHRLGYLRDELLAMSPQQILAPGPPDLLRNIGERLMRDQQLMFESALVAKDGEVIPVEVNTRLFLLHGRPTVLSFARDITERKLAEAEREQLITELRQALSDVKTLSGMLPICSHCKKVRDDSGYWTQLERFVHQRTDAKFSHGICPDCLRTHFPELADSVLAAQAAPKAA